MVGAKGFEPSTSWSRTRRASQAALRPDSEAERGQEITRRDSKNSTGLAGPASERIPHILQGLMAGITPEHDSPTHRIAGEANFDRRKSGQASLD
jgi:hypothetical protein